MKSPPWCRDPAQVFKDKIMLEYLAASSIGEEFPVPLRAFVLVTHVDSSSQRQIFEISSGQQGIAFHGHQSSRARHLARSSRLAPSKVSESLRGVEITDSAIGSDQ